MEASERDLAESLRGVMMGPREVKIGGAGAFSIPGIGQPYVGVEDILTKPGIRDNDIRRGSSSAYEEFEDDEEEREYDDRAEVEEYEVEEYSEDDRHQAAPAREVAYQPYEPLLRRRPTKRPSSTRKDDDDLEYSEEVGSADDRLRPRHRTRKRPLTPRYQPQQGSASSSRALHSPTKFKRDPEDEDDEELDEEDSDDDYDYDVDDHGVVRRQRLRTAAGSASGGAGQGRREPRDEGLCLPCPFGCGRTFRTRNQLKSHKRFHTKVRKYACEYPGCGKVMYRKQDLDRHRAVHETVKQHKCEGCGKRFTRRDGVCFDFDCFVLVR
ncbi:hypothetical protein HK101_002424 [Irineochytrium annulatum]|nr:hypothetical protein HK101_002424 [Irineochytrium annulatum]